MRTPSLIKSAIVAVALLSTASSFAFFSTNKDSEDTAALKESIEDLVTRVVDLEAHVKELETNSATVDNIKDLQTEGIYKEISEKLITPMQKTLDDSGTATGVWLKPQNNGTSVIASYFGKLGLYFRDIQPYAAGSKITLRVTNLSAVKLSRCAVRSVGYRTTNDEGTRAPAVLADFPISPSRDRLVNILVPNIPTNEFETLYVEIDSCAYVTN